MKIIKAIFYPIKESRAIFIQSFITFLLIGLLLLTKNYLNGYFENRYNYLDDNIVLEREEEYLSYSKMNIFEKNIEEKLKKYSKVLNDDKMKSILTYYITLQYNTDKNKTFGDANIFYSEEIENFFGFTSVEKFNCKTSINKGFYISSYVAEKEKINVGDYINLFTRKNGPAQKVVRVPIVGIWQTNNENIRYRIYSTLDVFSLDLDLKDEVFSPYYLFSGSQKINNKTLKTIINKEKNTIYSKQALVDSDLAMFFSFVKVADAYLWLCFGIMIISLAILIIIKEKKMVEINYINNIYYRNRLASLINIIKNNSVIVTTAFGFSILLLFIISLICLKIFKFYFFVGGVYFIMSLIALIVIIATTACYHLLFKKDNIFFKNEN